MQHCLLKSIRRTALVLMLSTVFLWGTIVGMTQVGVATPAQAASEQAVFDKTVAGIPPQQRRDCDGTETGRCNDGTCTHAESEVLACVFSGGLAEWYGADGPPPAPVVPPPAPVPTIEVLTEAPPPPPPSNLIVNGNFENGFYAVPELGFEPPDIGNVPTGWGWYRNDAYGKYTIFNNQTLGLECPYASDAPPQPVEDDPFFGPIPGVTEEGSTSALGLHIQSSDEQDARIGVFQEVDGLVPGQTYRFSMSGTLQIQSGATTLQPDDPEAPEQAQNHTIELYFDFTGNTDWQLIPHKNWTQIRWNEEKLEFQVSQDNDDLADIYSYETFVTAESNQMTLFLTLWRKWANWRTGIASIDCVALQPATPQMVQAAERRRSNFVDLSGGSNVQPAAAVQQGDTQLPITGDQAELPPELPTPAQPDPVEQPETAPPANPAPAVEPQAQPAQPQAVSPVEIEPQAQPVDAQVSETAPAKALSPPVAAQPTEAEVVETTAVDPPAARWTIANSPILIGFGTAVAAFVLIGAGLWTMRR